MRHPHRLAIPAYLIAAIMVVFPLMDFFVQVWPIALGDATWRYGAIGLINRLLITPLLGLFLVHAVALVLDHRLVLRIAATTNVLLVLFFIGAVGMFVLDGSEVRGMVTPDAQARFDRQSLSMILKFGITIFLTLTFAVTGWRGSTGALKARARRANAKSKPGIVAARETAPSSGRTGGAPSGRPAGGSPEATATEG